MYDGSDLVSTRGQHRAGRKTSCQSQLLLEKMASEMAETTVPTETSSSNMVTSHQQFTLHDLDAALPIMQALFDQTSEMEKASHYDWTRADNQVLFRSTFEDAESLADHFEQVMAPLIEQLLAPEIATRDRYAITGRPTDLETIKSRLRVLDAEYFESPQGLQTGDISQAGADNTGVATARGTLCTAHPTFKVHNWDMAAPIVREFIDRTGLEKGCTYFGWASNGDDLSWHGNYVSGSALREHFENVKPLIQALSSGPATLVNLELHGPSIELDKARASMEDIGPVLRFDSDNRVKRLVQRFEKP